MISYVFMYFCGSAASSSLNFFLSPTSSSPFSSKLSYSSDVRSTLVFIELEEIFCSDFESSFSDSDVRETLLNSSVEFLRISSSFCYFFVGKSWLMTSCSRGSYSGSIMNGLTCGAVVFTSAKIVDCILLT